MCKTDELRIWLDDQIGKLSQHETVEWIESNWDEAKEVLGQAYEYAIEARLPQAEIVTKNGHVRQLLCELLESLPKPAYLTRKQLAGVLQVCERTISRRVFQGSIPYPVKIGRLSRFLVKELEEYGISI